MQNSGLLIVLIVVIVVAAFAALFVAGAADLDKAEELAVGESGALEQVLDIAVRRAAFTNNHHEAGYQVLQKERVRYHAYGRCIKDNVVILFLCALYQMNKAVGAKQLGRVWRDGTGGQNVEIRQNVFMDYVIKFAHFSDNIG